MPPYRDICARARNPRGLLPFRSLKVCRNLFPRCGGRCFGFRRRRRLCRKDFRAVRRLPGAECVKDGGERLVDLGADLFVADDGDGVGHCDAMQGAYAEILADVVKSLEERLGQDGQGRDARAFELDLIDGEPCGTGPAVPGRRDDQISCLLYTSGSCL